MTQGDPIQRLVRELSKLPGIGQKTATRLAFHVLRAPAEQARDLANALIEIKERIRLCSVCMNLTEQDPCSICQDPARDPQVVCVVAYPPDLLAIEKTGSFRGRYHVLHGVLSPLEGIGPDDLRLRELLSRLSASAGMPSDLSLNPASSGTGAGSPVREVIVATSPNVEGEATAMYVARTLKPLGLKVTRIASGLPIGGDLEYADGVTIARALEVRRDM
jgi:recombination protein RecR